MPDPRPASHPAPDDPDPTHEIACELLGILPFGARAEALARCPRLAERVDTRGSTTGRMREGRRTGRPRRARPRRRSTRRSSRSPVRCTCTGSPSRCPGELVRHMLHVLLATRDLGWPGTDAPLSVRRVAAADLFFDATQTVLSDHDWKGPNGVEFALLTALAARVCHRAPRRAAVGAASWDDEGRARDTAGEMLGRLRRVQRPRGL